MSEQKIALVTGANKGIGLEIARQLGQQGITVLVGARDTRRGEEAARQLQQEGIQARFLPLDVTDQATIDSAAQTIAIDLTGQRKKTYPLAHRLDADSRTRRCMVTAKD